MEEKSKRNKRMEVLISIGVILLFIIVIFEVKFSLQNPNQVDNITPIKNDLTLEEQLIGAEELTVEKAEGVGDGLPYKVESQNDVVTLRISLDTTRALFASDEEWDAFKNTLVKTSGETKELFDEKGYKDIHFIISVEDFDKDNVFLEALDGRIKYDTFNK